MRLITTNDNIRALQFYQKRGFCFTKLYVNVMDDVVSIVKVDENKEQYMNLLLEADPDEDVVKKYIQEGEMYVVKVNGKALAEIFITKVDEETCELKNIATLPTARGKGLAKSLIEYVFNEYKGKYKKMIVGTTENMIPFYVLIGFNKYYKTVKNFFIDNYNKEIWDGNLQCMDMYYYYKEL